MGCMPHSTCEFGSDQHGCVYAWQLISVKVLLKLQESAVFSATDYVAKTVRAAEVKHPLLDKVRACSVNADQAADFFLWALHPTNTWRLTTEAANHPYLHPTYVKMLEEFPLPDSHPYNLPGQESTAERTGLQLGGPSTTCCAMLLHDGMLLST